jgi:transcriptional regulator with XRE-family HTH domain
MAALGSVADSLLSAGARGNADAQPLPSVAKALDGIAVLQSNHIGEIERGERNVTLGTLLKLAEALKVPLDRLLVGYCEADGSGLRTSPACACR